MFEFFKILFQWLKRIDSPHTVKNNSDLIKVKGQNFLVLPDADTVWSPTKGLYVNKLTLQKVGPKNAGAYLCLAANSIGYTVKNAFLEVLPGKNYF